jgi:hypothetical protein
MCDPKTQFPAGAEDLNILAHTQCRYVCHYFRDASTEVATVGDLEEFLREQAPAVAAETQAGIHLHHVTLPKLAETGVIEYDARSQTARYRGHPLIEHWLNRIVESDAGQPAESLLAEDALDTIFECLRHPACRRVLRALPSHSPRGEAEVPRSEADTTEADDVAIELHHVHLPKLAEAGYIEWDPATATIRRGPNFDEIAPLLDAVGDYTEDETND